MEDAYEKRGYLLEDFRLFHLKDDRGTDVGYHYHEFHKLVFLLSGSGGYVVEGRRYALQPGDIVLVGALSVHKPEFPAGQPYERVILYLSPTFLQQHSDEDFHLEDAFGGARGHVLRPGSDFRRGFLALLLGLEKELGGDAPGRVIVSRCLLLRAIAELERELLRGGTELPRPLAARDGKILEILRYLDDNLTSEISIDDLAARFYISKYHMMRRFRDEAGISIHTYLSDKRLLLARELIQNGESATNACFACGFKSYSAFSRAYGKLFGASPTGRSLTGAALAAEDNMIE